MAYDFNAFSAEFEKFFLAFKLLPSSHPSRITRFHEYVIFLGEFSRNNKESMNEIQKDILILRHKIEKDIRDGKYKKD